VPARAPPADPGPLRARFLLLQRQIVQGVANTGIK
jgi:hypothetical protein